MGKFKEDAKTEILKQLTNMPIIATACSKAGVPRSTYYRWRNDDSIFADMCDDAQREGIYLINDVAESKIIGNIKDGNQRASEFWLRHNNDRYQQKYLYEPKKKHFFDWLYNKTNWN